MSYTNQAINQSYTGCKKSLRVRARGKNQWSRSIAEVVPKTQVLNNVLLCGGELELSCMVSVDWSCEQLSLFLCFGLVRSSEIHSCVNKNLGEPEETGCYFPSVVWEGRARVPTCVLCQLLKRFERIPSSLVEPLWTLATVKYSKKKPRSDSRQWQGSYLFSRVCQTYDSSKIMVGR